jgi:hypothetical protein
MFVCVIFTGNGLRAVRVFPILDNISRGAKWRNKQVKKLDVIIRERDELSYIEYASFSN